jgi:hypothetical protein
MSARYLLLTEDSRLLSGNRGPLWANLRLWVVKSERLFSPKEKLKKVARASENGTHSGIYYELPRSTLARASTSKSSGR